MKLRILAATTASLLCLPAAGFAQFSYTSAEFNYVDVEVDVGPFNVDGDGFSLGGTYTVAETFFIGGSYEDYDLDFGVDGEVLRIGGGYFHPLDEDLDFVATLHFLDVEVSAGNQSADDDGIALAGGIRAQLTEEIQVDALLEYVDMDAGDSDTGIDLRGRYYLSPEFAIQVRATFGTDFETLSIGVRGEF
jgi:opacity protein-like surface antigen